MLPLIAQLHNNNNVVVSVFGRLLINVTDIDIVKANRDYRLAQATARSLVVFFFEHDSKNDSRVWLRCNIGTRPLQRP
ncbi:hypothetical protein BT092_03990 [Corynebacterium diphtheriae]|nr:hypothetical protein BT092_03990 [Corynebacterium diphtheriae]